MMNLAESLIKWMIIKGHGMLEVRRMLKSILRRYSGEKVWKIVSYRTPFHPYWLNPVGVGEHNMSEER